MQKLEQALAALGEAVVEALAQGLAQALVAALARGLGREQARALAQELARALVGLQQDVAQEIYPARATAGGGSGRSPPAVDRSAG